MLAVIGWLLLLILFTVLGAAGLMLALHGRDPAPVAGIIAVTASLAGMLATAVGALCSARRRAHPSNLDPRADEVHN